MIDKDKLAKDIGKRIARQCEVIGISHAALAKKAELTEAGVSRYISGQRLPRIDILLRLADALSCSTDYLLFGVGR